MQHFTQVQALLHLGTEPAQHVDTVHEVMRRVGLGDAQSLSQFYREGMTPEPIDESAGVWNVWVPAVVVTQLLADGQIWRSGMNADFYAELP